MNPAELRFLLVDDHPAVRDAVRNYLVEIGSLQVATAVDGLAALEMLRAAPYDFVISDIHMPRLNGFELLKAIKADPTLRHLPVVLMSTDLNEGAVAAVMQRGATACFLKSSIAELLPEVIRQAFVDPPRPTG